MELRFTDGATGKVRFHYFDNTKGKKTTACIITDESGNFSYGEVSLFYKDKDSKITGRNEALKKAISKFRLDDRKSVVLSMACFDFNFI